VDLGRIPPSPRRVRAAWEGGRRTRARWLEIGIPCLALSLALEIVAPMLVERWGTSFSSTIGSEASLEATSDLLVFWALLLVLAAGLSLLGVAVLGNLGAVTGRPRPEVGPIPVPLFVFGALLLLAASACVVAFGPVVAAASRAADASEQSLAMLWAHWATYLLGAIGVLLILAGVAEHLAMRHSSWRGLHLTPRQAQDEARERGGSRA
jgi:hypothetical protein